MRKRFVSLYFPLCLTAVFLMSTAGQQSTPRPGSPMVCTKYICCPRICGRLCARIGCDLRPGGPRNCCQRNILRSGRMCATKSAPCIRQVPGIPEQVPPPRGVKNAVCTGEFCCPERCGPCDGDGCGSRPGGSSNCCGMEILRTGRVCGTKPPPCIRTIPSGIPEQVPPPPRVTGAVCTSSACCPATCGLCDGDGCESRPGGYRNCCAPNILQAGKFCGTNAPPCIRQISVGVPQQIPPPRGVTNAACTRSFCCPARCGLCDGNGCGSRPGGESNCCGTGILRSGRVCRRRAPPCIRQIPAGIPKQVRPPRGVRNAVCTQLVCCTERCGLCDGNDCASRPGGFRNCCRSSILQSGRTCGSKAPPCVRKIPGIPEQVRPPRGVTNAVCTKSVCCPTTCDLCDGDGCGSRPGGASNCCRTAILESGRVCKLVGPPCIRGSSGNVPTPTPMSGASTTVDVDVDVDVDVNDDDGDGNVDVDVDVDVGVTATTQGNSR